MRFSQFYGIVKLNLTNSACNQIPCVNMSTMLLYRHIKMRSALSHAVQTTRMTFSKSLIVLMVTKKFTEWINNYSVTDAIMNRSFKWRADDEARISMPQETFTQRLILQVISYCKVLTILSNLPLILFFHKYTNSEM